MNEEALNFDKKVKDHLNYCLLNTKNIVEEKIINICLELSNIYSFSQYQTYPRPSHPLLSKRKEPYFTMVAILISLRTTLENEQKATIAFMERFKNIDDVLSSNIEEISQNIKCAGMPQNKAKSILEASKFIKSNFDNNWDFIKKMDLAKAREYILKISGVGEKSADCILELGLDLPSMVIDVNMLRIVSRIFNMEWAENPDLSNKKQLTKCKELLENNLSKDGFLFQIIHTLLLVHGKYICKSMPKCNECKIKKYCSFKNQQG